MQLDAWWMFSSIVWGSIGVGLIMYGRKETAPAFLGAGGILLLASYFCETTFWMSIISIVTLFALHRLKSL